MGSKPIFPRRRPTNLSGLSLNFGEMGPHKLVRCELSILSAVDARWPVLRSPDAENAHWRWLNLASKAHDAFALVDANSEAQGLWCSQVDGPRKINSKRYYRLDYMEIHPQARRGGLGLMLLCCVAARAKELGCDGVILGSLPSATTFWDKFGVRERLPGWSLPATLTAFVIEEKLEPLARIFRDAKTSA